MSLTTQFPPKVDELYNKNVLVVFESGARYRQLKSADFFRSSGVDLLAMHVAESPIGGFLKC